MFSRYSQHFKHSLDVWKEHISYCLRTNSTKSLSRVLGKALLLHPTSEDLWLIARHIEVEVKHDFDSARAVMQRAVDLNKRSLKLWIEYFKLELDFLKRHADDQEQTDSVKSGEVPRIVFDFAIKELGPASKPSFIEAAVDAPVELLSYMRLENA
jgi:hypothetical protein